MIMTFLTSLSLHARNVATVKFLRGDVKIQTSTKPKLVSIKVGDWINEGSLIKTGARSIAKLSLVDRSVVNIGPNSEMKIEEFSSKEAGVIEVISGKIRSKVSKDYLKMDKKKSKLFVKSKSAVMGIRGTDFIFSTNKLNGQSSAVLIEGSVVFNKYDGKSRGANALEGLVNKGVNIRPGQFSVTSC